MFPIQVSNPLSGWNILDVMSVLSVPLLRDLGSSAQLASEELEWIVRVSQCHALPRCDVLHAVDEGSD